MGTTYRAYCDCGFQTDVTEGGSKEGFKTHSFFPFWCDRCGLIEVNLRQKIKCPHCKSKEILPYGDPLITSDKHGENLIASEPFWGDGGLYDDSEDDESDEYEYEMPKVGNYSLCPRCRTFRLQFRSMILFD
jgi:predicted Zn-ribbon and HTH transcriptional regulator